MKYKSILLDIDDTLYSYDSAHSVALECVAEFFEKKLKIDKPSFFLSYEKARKQVHIELSETAASHNRLLYFQKMCEFLKINSLKQGIKLYDLYWDNFIKNLKPFDGVYDLLKKYKNKICLVTDLTSYIQYRKIEKLKLNDYCNLIVTSEETGKNKPHPIMFMSALKKLGVNANEACMIGDSFDKDIFGANNLGIDAIWVNYKKKKISYSASSIKEVVLFKEILRIV